MPCLSLICRPGLKGFSGPAVAIGHAHFTRPMQVNKRVPRFAYFNFGIGVSFAYGAFRFIIKIANKSRRNMLFRALQYHNVFGGVGLSVTHEVLTVG